MVSNRNKLCCTYTMSLVTPTSSRFSCHNFRVRNQVYQSNPIKNMLVVVVLFNVDVGSCISDLVVQVVSLKSAEISQCCVCTFHILIHGFKLNISGAHCSLVSPMIHP